MNNLSKVWSELYRRYHEIGMELLGGYSPFLVQNSRSAPFNYIHQNGVLKSTSGGIANDEASFLYSICELIKPKRILVIGNSYGFSTVFLSLANPKAKLVAFDKYRTKGLEVTSSLVKDLKDKHVVKGSTPEDIPNLIDTYLDGQVDLVLVDAVHTNEMQSAEWPLYLPYLSESAVVCFHDVISCGLIPSFESLKSANKDKFVFRLVPKTSSGMGLAIRTNVFDKHQNFFDYFCQSLDRVFSFGSYCSRNFNASATELADQIDIMELSKPPHPQL